MPDVTCSVMFIAEKIVDGSWSGTVYKSRTSAVLCILRGLVGMREAAEDSNEKRAAWHTMADLVESTGDWRSNPVNGVTFGVLRVEFYPW